MKDQLLLLQKLQEVDAKVREIQRALDALPEKLAPAKRDLAKLEDMLSAEQEHIQETDNWRLEQEELIKHEQEGLKNAKLKLQATKVAREYAAANREIENKKRSIHQREEEVFKVVEALEAKRTTLDNHTKDVQELRSHVAAEEAKQTSTITELSADLTRQMSGRDEMTEKLPADLLKRYEAVTKRRGLAVVPVVAGVCQGCHMRLPPQLNNILARFESIESCRQCGRLLYRIELLDSGESNTNA